MTERRLLLSNGLHCHLYHQPGARDAAALVRVQAGSLDEPDRWPGLAHLLEHLLFCGSERFRDSERLMPWVQQQGGLVNATTQLSTSAFFFQVPAAALPTGVERLRDMVAAPLLSQQAIQQEVAVIDAEYQLLQHHADTLSEAALVDTLGGPFQRLRVGNKQAFGDNVTSLQAALRTFHQRHYRANALQLWLQGPQPLDELAQVAEHFARGILPGAPVPRLSHPFIPHDALLQLPGDEHFWLTLMLSGDEHTLRDNVTLLSAFWQDEAPGSLLMSLRAAGLCETLHGQWLWQQGQQSWLALRFSAATLNAEQARAIEELFWQHLAAIGTTDDAQRQHYAQLSRQDFASLTPLEQLRGRALGFAPATQVPVDFATFVAALPGVACTRLLTQQRLAHAEQRLTQGFTLTVKSGIPTMPPSRLKTAFSFYPAMQTTGLPPLPPVSLALPRVKPRHCVDTLLLRPAFYHTLSDPDAQARQVLLRPVLAELRHAGGSGSWQQKQGVWQLVLNLPASNTPAQLTVHHALKALSAPAQAKPTAKAQNIVIRQLLAALPTQLIAPVANTDWLAAWCGEETPLHRRVAHQLSDFSHNLVTHAQPPRLQRGVQPVNCQGSDHALLLFIPLPQRDDASLAALRALALLLEPRFFQRLRVDQQIGYVVSARYQRVADVDGLLLALQSPHIAWQKLLTHCKRFMREEVEEVASITPHTLASWQRALLEQCVAQDNADAAIQALRQQQGLPTLTRHAVEALTVTQLQRLHARLMRERRRWCIVVAVEET